MATRDFGIVLGLAYQGFVADLHADLARRGFTDIGPTVGYVLRALADESMNQRQLSVRLGITDQGTMKIIDDMERRGFVVRAVDPDDARARRLELGARGVALLRAARRFHARFERELAAELGASVAATRRVLEHIAARAPGDAGKGRLRPM
ncbi:MAG TPA: MarR family transcriptional regulator [Kofleriaceae bacterium]|nr:MarR family transcriptional regulator [Kofleriaceae bacterium]